VLACKVVATGSRLILFVSSTVPSEVCWRGWRSPSPRARPLGSPVVGREPEPKFRVFEVLVTSAGFCRKGFWEGLAQPLPPSEDARDEGPVDGQVEGHLRLDSFVNVVARQGV
jgi:hypothetical protein